MTLEERINQLIYQGDGNYISYIPPIEDWGWDAMLEIVSESKEVFCKDDYIKYGLDKALVYLVDQMILEAPLELCLLSPSEYIRHRRVYKMQVVIK